MARPDKDVLERLGTDALTRVLDDLLDKTRLARLATACGLTYPGIRTRSQKRDRVLSDLVERAGTEVAARTAIFRTLKKETAGAARAWSRLDPEERDRRLRDEGYLLAGKRLGMHLFLLASSQNGPDDEAAMERLVSRKDLRRAGAGAGEAVVDDEVRKELARLQKKDAELRKKVKHLENQLVRSREIERALKKDLIQRKGEIAESRMLGERLQKELDASRGRARATTSRDPGDASLEQLVRAVRRLGSEQRTLTHAVEKRIDAPPGSTALATEALAPVVDALDELRKESAAVRKDRRQEGKASSLALEEIREELRAIRTAVASEPATRSTARRKGASSRVGVFIDVQNVYYGAKQLKGKLDFDALLQTAVRDRRLIQATAYVVESKEIDQSGFIARLQQRAISVRRKTLKVRSDGSMKGDWDMEMALDILDSAPTLDVVVLVSGDGDFTSLVKRLKSMGPRVEVVGFPRNTAKSLLEAADRFQPLDRKLMIRTEAVAAAEKTRTRKDGPRPAAPASPSRRAARAETASTAKPTATDRKAAEAKGES